VKFCTSTENLTSPRGQKKRVEGKVLCQKDADLGQIANFNRYAESNYRNNYPRESIATDTQDVPPFYVDRMGCSVHCGRLQSSALRDLVPRGMRRE